MDKTSPVNNATANITRSALILAAAVIGCSVALLFSAGHGYAVEGDVQIDANSFRCIRKMTPVRHFYVDSLSGQLDATLAAANSPTGAVYPPGSEIGRAHV